MPNETPTGVSVFPYDFRSVRAFAERSNNIVHWSQMGHGGHFAASQGPDLLVEDLRTYFRRSADGWLEGKWTGGPATAAQLLAILSSRCPGPRP